jgi:long-chain acyl-CoA synthetase
MEGTVGEAALIITATPGGRPFPWERSYPPAMDWDAPVDVMTLPAMLDEVAGEYGDRPALEYRGQRISYAGLRERADRFAAGLMRAGLAPGDRVALLLPNTPWHPIAFFGVLRAGGVVVHLTPLDPPRSSARKMADSGARWLVSTNLLGLLPIALTLLDGGHADRLILGEDEVWEGHSPGLQAPHDARILLGSQVAAEPDAPWPPLAAKDVAVLQYTGGTTGLPKGAMLTHANLTAAASMYRNWDRGRGYVPGPDERAICVLPLFHIYALSAVLLRALRTGVEVLLRPRFDVEGVLHDIEVGRATSFPGVPTMWIALAAHPGIEARDLSSLRYVGSGGAALPTETAQRFETLTGLRLGGGWGMTETSPAGTTLPPGASPGHGSIGLPLPGIEMDVVALDDPRRVLPPGEVGEIRIRGPNVTPGYWNRPEETAAAFVDGWFLTGDVGRMDEAGVFYIVDRRKEMIISGGFNVYPRTIEEAIHEHPDVVEAAVIGVPDAYRGQAAKAYVQMRDGAPPLTLEALRAFLADKLGRHEMPTALELREALPRTPVGKLAKRELAEEARAKAEG